MKAIQISGLRQMQIVSVPEQELHADEVLLRLEYPQYLPGQESHGEDACDPRS